MYVYRKAASVIVQAPAKLNLFFEVLGRRSDGFHEIETLMAPISLYDTLTFTAIPSGDVSLDCRWALSERPDSSLGTLPPAAENLATRAAALLRTRSGTTQGARMRLVKRIPAAAGLGGGSSDAAAVLAAANLAWQLDWPLARLQQLAAELGSDVPFFLAGGAAVCTGRGEHIEPVRRQACLHAVVVRPPEGLSTAQVYARCRPGSADPSGQAQLSAPGHLAGLAQRPLAAAVQALAAGNPAAMGRALHNRLEPAARELSPWVSRLEREFSSVGCAGAQMSGSGTSYFGICHHARHARRVAGRLRSRAVGRVYAVRI